MRLWLAVMSLVVIAGCATPQATQLSNELPFEQAVAQATALDPEIIGALYRVDPATVRIFRLPSIRVVKISFPRRATQGGVADRDMHAGQQHVPLARLRLDATAP